MSTENPNNNIPPADTASAQTEKPGFFKKTPVRLISAFVLFFLFVGVITYVIAYPFDRIYANGNQFNVIFLGASETEWGINPILIDSATMKKSCLMATSGVTYEYRYEIMESAIRMKSLEQVVIEVSYGSMKKDMDSFPLDCKVLVFPRLSGIGSKIRTAFRKMSFWEDEFDQVFAEEIYEGINAWKTIGNGIYPYAFDLHGYVPQEWADQMLTAEEAAEEYNSEHIITDFPENNQKYLVDIIRLCQDHGVDVCIITMPLSESYVWRYDGWDEFHDLMVRLTEENNVDYYDFNLWTNRQHYLFDDVSYRDEEHMCDTGSNEFSRIVGQLVNDRLHGREPRFQFYDSYAQAKEHSTYQKFLSQQP